MELSHVHGINRLVPQEFSKKFGDQMNKTDPVLWFIALYSSHSTGGKTPSLGPSPHVAMTFEITDFVGRYWDLGKAKLDSWLFNCRKSCGIEYDLSIMGRRLLRMLFFYKMGLSTLMPPCLYLKILQYVFNDENIHYSPTVRRSSKLLSCR